MRFDPKNHIIGKVYGLTQENMNAMIQEIEAGRAENALMRETLIWIEIDAREISRVAKDIRDKAHDALLRRG